MVSRPLCRVGQAPDHNIKMFLHEVLQNVPSSGRYICNLNDVAITCIKVIVVKFEFFRLYRAKVLQA